MPLTINNKIPRIMLLPEEITKGAKANIMKKRFYFFKK